MPSCGRPPPPSAARAAACSPPPGGESPPSPVPPPPPVSRCLRCLCCLLGGGRGARASGAPSLLLRAALALQGGVPRRVGCGPAPLLPLRPSPHELLLEAEQKRLRCLLQVAGRGNGPHVAPLTLLPPLQLSQSVNAAEEEPVVRGGGGAPAQRAQRRQPMVAPPSPAPLPKTGTPPPYSVPNPDESPALGTGG